MKKGIYIFVGCLVLFIGFIFFRNWQRSRMLEAVLQVQGKFWQRRVYVEEYLPDTLKAWANELPNSATKISSEIVPKGTNYVVRQETYTEMERYRTYTRSPVYTRQPSPPTYAERPVTRIRNIWAQLTEDREMITYEKWRWKEANEASAATASGDETQEPVWLKPITDSITIRPSRSTEYYSILLATTEGEPKTYSRPVSLEEWRTFKKGQRVTAKFYGKDGEPVTFTIIK